MAPEGGEEVNELEGVDATRLDQWDIGSSSHIEEGSHEQEAKQLHPQAAVVDIINQEGSDPVADQSNSRVQQGPQQIGEEGSSGGQDANEGGLEHCRPRRNYDQWLQCELLHEDAMGNQA